MMAELIKELFDWTAAETGLIPAVEYHCGHFPPSSEGTAEDDGAVLLDIGGEESQPVIRGNVGEAMFQVLARGRTYFTADNLAQMLHRVLSDCAGADLGEHQVYVIDAVSRPQMLPLDERMRFEMSTTYLVRFVRKADWP